jgi:adenosylhomocysteine nucleosidase
MTADLPGRIIIAAAMDQELAPLKIAFRPSIIQQLPPPRPQKGDSGQRSGWANPLESTLTKGETSEVTSKRILSRLPFEGGTVLDVELLRTGIGVAKTAESLGRCLAQGRVQAVLGIGFAGGLSPELQAGDLVIASRIRRSGVTMSVSPNLLAAAGKVRFRGTPLHFGTFITVDQILGDSRAKGSLAASLENHEVGCVDMESSAISQVCSERDIPFLIARCVADRLGEDLPIDFNRCRKSDGEIETRKVLLCALRHPGALAGLWGLRNRSRQCAENLADFVKEFLRAAFS